MEQHGLEQVIAELKTRGVKAGEEEAARILADAKARAEPIVSEARKEAEALRKQAEAERAATKAALEAELAQASRVGLAAFRQAIERGFLVPEVDEALRAAIDRPAFLEEAISEIVKAFAASGLRPADIDVVLPERRRAELGALFQSKLAARGAEGVRIRFDESLAFGFRIGPRGGGFFFDLSDEGFREIFVRFLSPRFRQAFYRDGAAGQGGARP